MKKIFLSFMLCLFFVSYINAVDINSAITDIKNKAIQEKYRFVQVEKINETIRKDLAENDTIYLGDKPVGSVTVNVIDSLTGKAVKDANCMLAFSSKRSTVNTDGSSNQIANPFLLFNLGKTTDSGTAKFTDTYFYRTSKITDTTYPYTDSLQVGLATLVDQDPTLTINYSAKTYLSTSNEELYNKLVNALNKKTSIKFSEFKEILKTTAKEEYAGVLRYLFDDEFAVYSDDTIVKIYATEKQNEKLISQGKQEVTIKELREYIKTNKDLFDEYVAYRHYESFNGFETNYTITHEPPYESTITYKDGTTSVTNSTAYLGMKIFDEASGGTAPVLSISGFSYKAYVYVDGYKEGLAIGSLIRQDLINKDIVMNIYLSKDVAPVVNPKDTNAVFGTLKNEKNEPIPNATITIVGTDIKTKTDSEGQFSFTKLIKENFKVSIINPENGKELEAKAIYNESEYDLNNIPINLTNEGKAFQIALVSGKVTSSSFNFVLLFLLLIIVIIIVYILFKRQKKVNKKDLQI